MGRLLTAVLLSTSLNAVAQTSVPNVFEDGTPASAAEVNANFDALEAQIDSDAQDFEQFQVEIEAALPPSDCATNQIIRWNGDEWICDDDPLANLSCTDGQSLVYREGAIDCGCTPPGAAISDGNFREALNEWNTSGAASPYGDIALWCTGNVTDMESAFEGNASFNADISDWDTGKVTNMAKMFDGATSFNQDISQWNVSSVSDMSRMFSQAQSFNQNIGIWDVHNVSTMLAMFYDAEAFDANIGGWDVSNVATMEQMFYGAESFNQDIGSWNVSNVTSMEYMFWEAFTFNQDLSSWVVPSDMACSNFAYTACCSAWAAAYGGSIYSTPPLSLEMRNAGCGL